MVDKKTSKKTVAKGGKGSKKASPAPKALLKKDGSNIATLEKKPSLVKKTSITAAAPSKKVIKKAAKKGATKKAGARKGAAKKAAGKKKIKK